MYSAFDKSDAETLDSFGEYHLLQTSYVTASIFGDRCQHISSVLQNCSKLLKNPTSDFVALTIRVLALNSIDGLSCRVSVPHRVAQGHAAHVSGVQSALAALSTWTPTFSFSVRNGIPRPCRSRAFYAGSETPLLIRLCGLLSSD